MEVRVKDAGESEGHLVMRWIGVQTLPFAKASASTVSGSAELWWTVTSERSSPDRSFIALLNCAGMTDRVVGPGLFSDPAQSVGFAMPEGPCGAPFSVLLNFSHAGQQYL